MRVVRAAGMHTVRIKLRFLFTLSLLNGNMKHETRQRQHANTISGGLRKANTTLQANEAEGAMSCNEKDEGEAGLCLVLDIDGTLIDSCSAEHAAARGLRSEHVSPPGVGSRAGGEHVFKRPYVDEFLDFVCERFAHVAVWTLASPEWAGFVLAHVLQRPISDFAFVWCGDRASKVSAGTTTGAALAAKYDLCTPGMYQHVKDLAKVWKNAAVRAQTGQPGFTRFNTLIVEDTPSNCVRNTGNAIYVPTFTCDDSRATAEDTILRKLCLYLDFLTCTCTNVRSHEKRGWLASMPARWCTTDVCANTAAVASSGQLYCAACAAALAVAAAATPPPHHRSSSSSCSRIAVGAKR